MAAGGGRETTRRGGPPPRGMHTRTHARRHMRAQTCDGQEEDYRRREEDRRRREYDEIRRRCDDDRRPRGVSPLSGHGIPPLRASLPHPNSALTSSMLRTPPLPIRPRPSSSDGALRDHLADLSPDETRRCTHACADVCAQSRSTRLRMQAGR